MRMCFAVPVAMAVVFNCVFLLALWLGHTVAWLPWAVLVAGAVTFAVHVFAVVVVFRRAGLRWVWRWRADRRYRQMRRALGPTILAGGARQSALLVRTFWPCGW